MAKKQIWLRPDQAELVKDALQFVEDRITSYQKQSSYEVVSLSGNYTRRQITEVLSLFEDKQIEGSKLCN